MKWGMTESERRIHEAHKDTRWFAWYPVKLMSGRWCWLERVRRQWHDGWGGGGWNYYA